MWVRGVRWGGNTGNIPVWRRETCALLKAKTSALLRRKTCAVLRARTSALLRANAKAAAFGRRGHPSVVSFVVAHSTAHTCLTSQHGMSWLSTRHMSLVSCLNIKVCPCSHPPSQPLTPNPPALVKTTSVNRSEHGQFMPTEGQAMALCGHELGMFGPIC